MTMTTPTRTRTAKTPEAPKTETPAVKAFDFTTLTPVKAVVPSGIGRTGEDLSKFKAWIQDSWSERKNGEKVGGGRGFPAIPAEHIGSLKSKLRKAAAELELGVNFAEDKVEGGVVLRYAAALKRAYKPRAAKPAETPAVKAEDKVETPAENKTEAPTESK